MTHGEVKLIDGRRVASPEYNAWQAMKNRCLNPKGQDWKHYGGRGIRVAKRWLEFENFLADMGRRPSPRHTLDRKNNNGPYCKSNCRWATRQQQAQNRNYCAVTPQLAKEIRDAYANGEGDQKALAKRYGISQPAVSLITRGRTWKNAGGIRKHRSHAYRNERGQKNGNAKVSDYEARIIQQKYATKEFTQKQLGAQYGLSQAQVSKIVLGLRRCS